MKSTTDIWFASYLRMGGIPVADFTVISKFKGRYFFDLTDEEYKEHKLGFVKSDISRVKQIIEELKDLLH